jgi:superfamily I DNA/RNA helicase
MIFMPTIFAAPFPSYKLVMVDEAQDLSLIQHVMLNKLCRASRLIAVGDPCQSIYGFRGAHQDSMDHLKKTFDMETLYLTTSFRCPVAVTQLAQRRAPDMNAPSWAQAGSVNIRLDWNVGESRTAMSSSAETTLPSSALPSASSRQAGIQSSPIPTSSQPSPRK